VLKRGCTLDFCQKWGFYFIYDFYDFSAVLEILVIFGGYWALFEARSWGEVGRLLPTSSLYKPEVLEAMEEVQNRFMLKILSQSHFYAGKPLRRAPLRAISGSSVHPISVPSVLLGS
jgi:hypothetical protein